MLRHFTPTILDKYKVKNTPHYSPFKTFALPNIRRYHLLWPSGFNSDQLNRLGNCTLSELEWVDIWFSLWTSDLTYQAKIFLWRILANGLFSGARAAKTGIASGECLLCPGAVESLSHIFSECTFARSCWQANSIAFPVFPLLNNGGLTGVLMSLSPRSTETSLCFFIIHQLLWMLWTCRNEQLFGFPDSRSLDFHVLFAAVKDHLYLVALSSSLTGKHSRVNRALLALTSLKAPWPRYFSYHITSAAL